MAGLRVDSREALLRGGETGPAVVPGDPEKSALLKVVQHAEGFPRMPRGRAKLPAADIEVVNTISARLERWESWLERMGERLNPSPQSSTK